MIIVVSATQKPYQMDMMSYMSTVDLPGCKSQCITNNTKGLSEVYNEIIDRHVKDGDLDGDDILLFIHDDLVIEDQYLSDKLEKALNMFDVVGVAGAKSYHISHPNVWHKCPREHMVGVVNHNINDKYYSTYFGPSPSSALIIDGIFIAVKMKTFIENPTLRFHPAFTFHFYDLYFSVEAYSLKLKIGVYPISVCHHSAGNWNESKVWHDLEPVFEKSVRKRLNEN